MKPLHGLVLTCALVALTGLIGCRSSGKPRVAFVSNNPEKFWTIVRAGAEKSAEEHGVELLFKMPTPGNAATQKEVVDTVLAQGVKAIAISVIDPKNQSEYLDEVAAKAKLLTVDNDAPRSKRLGYIGTDNYQAGRAAGKLVKEAMPKGGTVAIFVGTLDALNARQRRQGVIDELAGNKAPENTSEFEMAPDGVTVGEKYKLHKRTYTEQPVGSAKALENAIDAVTTITDDDVCLVGLWAYNPPQCLTAVKDKVKDKTRRDRIRIVGFDEDFVTLDGVKEGSIQGTVVQNPYEFGYQSVKSMAALARGEDGAVKEKINYVPFRVVVSGKDETEQDGVKRIGVDVFRPQLEKQLGKTK